jgi:4,5-DOPA dioxygenase extradiol
MTSILHAPVEGAAFDAFLQHSAPASRDHEKWRPEHGTMPALYLSHGAPPVFNDAHWMDQLFAWSRSLPKPTAILIVSAHWEAAPLALSAPAPGTQLI